MLAANPTIDGSLGGTLGQLPANALAPSLPPLPLSSLGIGIDAIPAEIRSSTILTGNDLGMLGNVEMLPTEKEVQEFLASNLELRVIIDADDKKLIHSKAQEYLHKNDVLSAWKVLLSN